MKTTGTILLFSLCGLVSISGAVLVEIGSLEEYLDASEEQRALISVNVNQQCTNRLNKCQTNTGGGDLPIADWSSKISSISENDPTMEQFATLVSTTDGSDFQGLVTAANDMSGGQAVVNVIKSLLALVSQLGKLKPGSDVASSASSLEDIANSMNSVFKAGLGQNITLMEWIVFIVTFIIGFIRAIPGGPIAVLQFAIEAIITFLATAGADVATVAVARNADTDCFSALLKCNYNEMMMKVVPATIGTAYLYGNPA